MSDNAAIGKNITRWRRRRTLTQVQLASLAGISRSRLSDVENGKEAPSAMWVGIVASALNVDASVLKRGEDTELDQADVIVPTVRRVVASVDLLPDIDPEPLERLVPLVEQVGRWRHAAAYTKITEVLPELVDQLLVAGLRDGAPAYELLVTLFRAGNTLSHKTGHYDLSTLATERMVWAATQSGDPLLIATTQYVKSAALARVGETQRAMQLADRTISEIESLADDQSGAAVLCALHMRRAGLAALFTDTATAETHFAEARALAERVGDRQSYGTVVGPTNLKLWEMSAQLDLGEIGKAMEIAEEVRLPEGFPKERRAHFWLDWGRAYLSAGKPDAAIEALANAKEASREYFRKSRAVDLTLDTIQTHPARIAADKLRPLLAAAGKDL
ncbi:helix-turn-helix domain-containing protein [Nocardia brasiliensis]|uniref:helix-turn-helix domain-containing protein n=1 Tax=Nocardia brasiliensis TaxID=37326 RepID=UPI0004A74111|nr:helix-turn-helix transcriptional regulator [Nocardia brasiliensis]